MSIGADIFIPREIAARPAVFFCVPGAGFTRGYYSLEVDGDFAYSFAHVIAAAGHCVVTLDPIGIGTSTRPKDGHAVTPHVISAANQRIVRAIKALFNDGAQGLPRLSHVKAVGVGHSMGGMIVSIDQAEGRCYDGVVLLGSAPVGLDWALPDEARAYTGDPVGARENIVRLSRAIYPEAYYTQVLRGRGAAIYGGTADKRILAAVKDQRAPTIGTPGLFSMIPGSFGPESAAIDVPLMLAIGEVDIVDQPHRLPALYPASRDVTLVILPKTGHTHFAFPTAPHLFRRILDWVVPLTEDL